jgi:hypothetical protein
MMCQLILIIFFLALAPALASAQSADERRGQGYVFVAPGAASGGGTTASLHFGVGGEGLVYKGLGAGGEIGYFAPARGLGEGFGIFSANGSYHFRDSTSSRKLIPFVTGGYSLLFHSGTAHAFNVGGGVNYWFRDRLGLRLEFRDHVLTNGGTVHYYGFRIGLAFR